jgi:hypothetical protein
MRCVAPKHGADIPDCWHLLHVHQAEIDTPWLLAGGCQGEGRHEVDGRYACFVTKGGSGHPPTRHPQKAMPALLTRCVVPTSPFDDIKGPHVETSS